MAKKPKPPAPPADDAALRAAYAAITRCLNNFNEGTWDLDNGGRRKQVVTSATLAELQAAAQAVTGSTPWKARAVRVLLYLTFDYLHHYPNAIEESRRRLQWDYFEECRNAVRRCDRKIDKVARASGRSRRLELASFLRTAVALELEMLTSASPSLEFRAAALGLRVHKKPHLRLVHQLRGEE